MKKLILFLALLVPTFAVADGFKDFNHEPLPAPDDILVMEQADSSATNYTLIGDLMTSIFDIAYQANDLNMILWPASVDATEVSYLDGLTGSLPLLLGGKEDNLGTPSTDGQILSGTIAGARIWIDPPTGGGTGLPGGNDGTVQFNDNGVLGGSDMFTFNPSTGTVSSKGYFSSADDGQREFLLYDNTIPVTITPNEYKLFIQNGTWKIQQNAVVEDLIKSGGVDSIIAGTGIAVSSNTGDVTISATGGVGGGGIPTSIVTANYSPTTEMQNGLLYVTADAEVSLPAMTGTDRVRVIDRVGSAGVSVTSDSVDLFILNGTQLASGHKIESDGSTPEASALITNYPGVGWYVEAEHWVDGGSSGPSYILDEDFAGTVRPSGWTEAEAGADYSVDGSVALPFGSRETYDLGSVYPEVYLSALVNFGTATSTNNTYTLELRTSSLSAISMRVLGQRLVLYYGAIKDTTAGSVFSPNTDLCVWLHYVKPSVAGNDGYGDIRIAPAASGSCTYADSSTILTVSDGTETADIDHVGISHRSYDVGSDIVYSRVIMSDTVIGDF